MSSSTPPAPPLFFPLAQYISLVGVHTTLLCFTALFLPRTPLLELTSPYFDPAAQTSRDRPQHPFLEALTRSPVATVGSICVGVGVLQVWWGTWMRRWWINYHMGKGEREGGRGRMRRMMTHAWIATFVGSIILQVVLVLFGAPMTSHIPETYVLSLLLSLLTIYTPSLTLGPLRLLSTHSQDVITRMTWVRLFAEFSIRTPIDRALVYPSVGTLVGCWLGVIPIALDWDRPWQAWPLTPALGALLGYILASLLAVTINATWYFADEHMRMVGMEKKAS